jgi:hypothetical protein
MGRGWNSHLSPSLSLTHTHYRYTHTHSNIHTSFPLYGNTHKQTDPHTQQTHTHVLYSSCTNTHTLSFTYSYPLFERHTHVPAYSLSLSLSVNCILMVIIFQASSNLTKKLGFPKIVNKLVNDWGLRRRAKKEKLDITLDFWKFFFRLILGFQNKPIWKVFFIPKSNFLFHFWAS